MYFKLKQSLKAACFLGECAAVLSLVHGEGGSSFEFSKKNQVTRAKRLNSTDKAS
jgi:hypothetical protein